MKKLLLPTFLLSILLMFTLSDAQGQGIGISAGANFANFVDTDASVDSRTGVMAGLTYGIAVPMSPVTIQPGVFYAQKGATLSDGDIETTTKLDYIEIPVIAKFDFILDNPMLTPHVFFGPYAGFTLNAEQEVSDGNTSGSVDIGDQVKDTDIGVVVGAGADINKFRIGIRYSVGLTDVAETDIFNGKNGVLSLVAGINL